ncbi:hypothetical protein OAG76_04405, partial [Rubripirellula sp.]
MPWLKQNSPANIILHVISMARTSRFPHPLVPKSHKQPKMHDDQQSSEAADTDRLEIQRTRDGAQNGNQQKQHRNDLGKNQDDPAGGFFFGRRDKRLLAT